MQAAAQICLIEAHHTVPTIYSNVLSSYVFPCWTTQERHNPYKQQYTHVYSVIVNIANTYGYTHTVYTHSFYTRTPAVQQTTCSCEEHHMLLDIYTNYVYDL